MQRAPVTGRFAPSPSGDLHFGSLICAIGSFLEAKSIGGRWLLRIEDLDPPREVAGSAQRIITGLARLGMVSDAPVLYQSSRVAAYQSALDRLLEAGCAYPCICSRNDLPPSGIYPGTCRNGIPDGSVARAIRFRLADKGAAFDDRIQGHTSTSEYLMGDFVIRRADGLFAYQLAVVVDDAFQHITQVVRGADLLDSSLRQVQLQKALGLEQPVYMHLPVALAANGQKLSKRFAADPINHQDPVSVVCSALEFLGHRAPIGLSLDALWCWAIENWRIDRVPRYTTLAVM